MNNFYELKLENDVWLDPQEFVAFCMANQDGDITIQVNNEGHCLEYCGVYAVLELFRFNSVTIKTSNVLEQHDKYVVQTPQWIHWLKQIQGFDFHYDYTWNKQKIFGCFYGRPSAPRLGIATHLIKSFKDISHVRTKFVFGDEDSRKLFDIQRLFTWHPDIVNDLHLLDDASLAGDQQYIKGKYQQSNNLSHQYENFLIDLVVEPVCEGRSFYPTEKTVRAMLCRRPFIVMASCNYLAYLRQMGFRTFNDYWDENYDGYGSQKRYSRILDLIDDLAAHPHQHFVDLYHAMADDLDHNYRLLVNQSYREKIIEIT